jgi:MoaA/NifB/PqqE/SkfB family radical SAM enzyme
MSPNLIYKVCDIGDNNVMVFRIPCHILEIHVAHACNLTCQSCSHFSNSGHNGILSLEEFEAWCLPWSSKIIPKHFRLLGGEPTINPKLTQMLLRAHDYWPESTIRITTNGFFLDRHPDIYETLGRIRGEMTLTKHDFTPEYEDKYNVFKKAALAGQEKHGFSLNLELSYKRWTRRHKGEGPDVLPYNDQNPKMSFKNCVCRRCHQLFRGRIWKCPPITYLQLQKEKHPDLSAEWDPYLTYEALSPSASQLEVLEFLTRRTESICAMCPVAPERFDKPSPLIPLGELQKQKQHQEK